jgi:hypothetical protein
LTKYYQKLAEAISQERHDKVADLFDREHPHAERLSLRDLDTWDPSNVSAASRVGFASGPSLAELEPRRLCKRDSRADPVLTLLLERGIAWFLCARLSPLVANSWRGKST